MKKWIPIIMFALLALMWVALFTSRALLSVLMMVFVAYSYLSGDVKGLFRKFISSPLLWGISLLFLIPLLTGLWSSDKDQWLDIIRIKLPLLVLPLAFAGPVNLSRKNWERLAILFVFLTALATFWTMFYYFSDLTAVNESYLRAKTMVTPLGNDHVRFSWLVAIAALFSGWLAIQKSRTRSKLFWVLAILCTWFIIFLHILAARTGLLSIYIMATGLFGWMIFSKISLPRAIGLLSLIIILPVLAYTLLPSFRNRIKYIRYDFSYFREAQYLPGANDAVRVISIQTGWRVMQENPIIGVGFGDISSSVQEDYRLHYPQMRERDRILPSSEWMIYGSGSGWPGLLLFTLSMLIPFFIRIPDKFIWWLLNATAAFSFIFDIGLEVQFGVFIYAFLILCCHRWLVTEKI